jgi:hypothetical protein
MDAPNRLLDPEVKAVAERIWNAGGENDIPIPIWLDCDTGTIVVVLHRTR